MSQPQHYSLRWEARGEVVVVHFVGDELLLYEENTRGLAGELFDLVQGSQRPELILDLHNVAAVSTPALVILVMLRKRLLAASKQLTLCNLRPAVTEVLEITKLNRLFPLRQEELLPKATTPFCPAA